MIGSGGFAARHLQTLAPRDDIQVVGHVARSRDSSERAARHWGGRAYDDVAALLQAERVDAAWVTVPPDAHDGVDEVLVERGVPFLVEKPLSADRATAARIGQALNAAGLVTAVGYQWRAMDTLPEVRRALGEHPVRMVRGAWHGDLPAPAWWRAQARSGGQMVEQATHLFDLARHLLGEARVTHAAEGDPRARPGAPEVDVAGVSSASLRFESGPLGVFTAVNVLPAGSEVQLQLLCDGLEVTITREGAVLDDGRERRELRRMADPVATQNDAFLRAARAGDPSGPLSTYQDALRTHHLTFDVLDAFRNERP